MILTVLFIFFVSFSILINCIFILLAGNVIWDLILLFGLQFSFDFNIRFVS